MSQPDQNSIGKTDHLSLEIDAYAEHVLPSDYEIVEVLGDIIQAEYADLAEDGKSIIRGGIILPVATVDNRAWRIVKVLLVGPLVPQIKPGQTLIIPGDKGIKSISRNGKLTVFINVERVFGICKPIVDPVQNLMNGPQLEDVKSTKRLKKKVFSGIE